MDGNVRQHFLEKHSGLEGAWACITAFKYVVSNPKFPLQANISDLNLILTAICSQVTEQWCDAPPSYLGAENFPHKTDSIVE